MHTFLNEHIYIPPPPQKKTVVQWTGMFVCKLVSKPCKYGNLKAIPESTYMSGMVARVLMIPVLGR